MMMMMMMMNYAGTFNAATHRPFTSRPYTNRPNNKRPLTLTAPICKLFWCISWQPILYQLFVVPHSHLPPPNGWWGKVSSCFTQIIYNTIHMPQNRPFAGSGHMVQNKLHWDANDAVGLPKQRNSYQSSPTLLFWKSHCVICVPV